MKGEYLMKRLFRESSMCRIFNTLAIVMFSLLFHYCLELTGVNHHDLEDERIYFERTSILWNMLLIVLAVMILYFVGKAAKWINTKRKKNILLGVFCVIAALISLYWVSASGTAPRADQYHVSYYASRINHGDFFSLQKGEYLANCPQQLGMVTFLRVLFAIFGDGNYMAFQYFTAVTVPVTVLAGCMIVRILSMQSTKAELFYLVFAVTCFPMYAYTPFVYGDLCSVSFLMLSVWGFLSCFSKFSWWKVAGVGISLGIAVILRTNVVILLISMLIVIFVRFIQNRDWRMGAIGGGLLLGVLFFQFLIKGIYIPKTDPDADAIPASCYVVMGLNDNGIHPGWYNVYNYEIFAEYDFDAEAAGKRAMQDLRTYINTYREKPSYMIDFFTRKMNAQWNAPMYQCLVMNNKVERKQSFLIENIYQHGKLGKLIEFYATLYQHLLYGSILYVLVSKRKQISDISYYTLLIAVFGGFLFSLLWEAKTRYVFPYLLMMLPHMAMGIDAVTERNKKTYAASQ